MSNWCGCTMAGKTIKRKFKQQNANMLLQRSFSTKLIYSVHVLRVKNLSLRRICIFIRICKSWSVNRHSRYVCIHIENTCDEKHHLQNVLAHYHSTITITTTIRSNTRLYHFCFGISCQSKLVSSNNFKVTSYLICIFFSEHKSATKKKTTNFHISFYGYPMEKRKIWIWTRDTQSPNDKNLSCKTATNVFHKIMRDK